MLDQVRDAIRLKHYSYRTEQSYVAWIRRYILFHNKRHPKDMGSLEVETFLTHLAVTEDVYKDFKDLADKIASRTELVLPNSQLTLEPELK
ncbi:phage integrase N-terminal SAM-like domain-containing protein [Sodalinema gerasimenkoae]|uniref:phage integrase N-terminal SAM-like domain-containing protein n=1 Tax=Sodalinema gerasimenkoae TaxID=2862348 RepID=UPI003CCE43F8